MQRRPVVRPLGGAEVSVAVRGPSPGEGGGKNQPDVGTLDLLEAELQ